MKSWSYGLLAASLCLKLSRLRFFARAGLNSNVRSGEAPGNSENADQREG